MKACAKVLVTNKMRKTLNKVLNFSSEFSLVVESADQEMNHNTGKIRLDQLIIFTLIPLWVTSVRANQHAVRILHH